MTDDAIAKLESGEAWNEFCDLLRKAGDILQRRDIAASPLEIAEGHRYLGRLLRAGLMAFGERSGARFPVFRAMPDGVKMGLDNPDNYYVSATVSGTIRIAAAAQAPAAHDAVRTPR